MKYNQLIDSILSNIGGTENIQSLTHCYTRLRFVLKDFGLADHTALSEIKGVAGVVEKGGQLQIVIGNEASEVFKAFNDQTLQKEETHKQGKTSFVDTVSAIFFPVIGLMCASGLIKGLVSILVATHLITDTSSTYIILQAIGDAVFYFLPAFLGYTTAKRFNSNPFLGLAIGLIMVYPSIIGISTGETLSTLFTGSLIETPVKATLFGVPAIIINYSSSVFPVIVTVWFASYMEQWVSKVSPKVLKSFLPSFVTLIVMVPLALLVVGPIISIASQLVATFLTSIYGFSPILTCILIAFTWQILIMFGLHGMIFPIIFMNLALTGTDYIFPAAFVCSFTQIAASIAIGLNETSAEKRGQAFSAAISSVFGITEPAIYGVTLPHKKGFMISCVASAIGGIIIGIGQVKMYVLGGMGVFGFINFVTPNGTHDITYAIIAVLVATTLTFIATYIVSKKGKGA